jgi:methyl-accepting chemotaxis protein
MLRRLMSSIRNKLLLITGAGTSLVLLAAMLGFLQLHTSLSQYREFIDSDLQGSRAILALGELFDQQVSQWNDLLLTGASAAAVAQASGALQTQAGRVQSRYATTASELRQPDALRLLQQFQEGHAGLERRYRDALSLFEREAFHPAGAHARLQGEHRRLQGLLGEARERIFSEMDQGAAAANTRAKQAIVLSLALMALGVACAFAVFLWMLQKGVVAPARRLVADLDRLAEGDFSHPVGRSTEDEIGQIAHSAQQIQRHLGQMIGQLRDAIVQVAAAAEEMAVVSQQTGEGVREQQGETTQVATAMNEMTATVQEVARNAVEAARAAEQADGEARSGRDVVEGAVGAISALASEVETAAGVLQRLEQDSSAIGSVLNVIRGIAEQTNLLALNAAIEAARAGEQGRGFAVVADEVRALAQRTQESTQEIDDMIGRLQVGTQETVQAMESGRTQARDAVDQAQRAGGALATITQAVAAIKDMNALIASASEEQSAVAEEMNRNIVTISRVAEQSAEGASQTTRSSQELARLGEQLQQLVSRFRT